MYATALATILAGVCVLALAHSVSAQTVTRGPYLQVGTPTSIIVRWRTDNPTDSRVLYGQFQGSLTRESYDSTITTEHELQLTGLSPQTSYYYAIGNSAGNLAGDDADHVFTTSPEPGSHIPTRVWVIGDSGTANFNAAAVRDAFIEFNEGTHAQAWLMLGDNAYADGTDIEYQVAVFDMYASLLRKTVLWPTLGNHDGRTADSATLSGPYYDIFTLPRFAEAGGLASGTEAYYSFDYANIHFICLNSYDSDRTPSGPMLTWLQNDLAATTQTWIIAYWHHPPYSKGSHDSDVSIPLRTMRENVLPILESYGVDLVLSGHSHSYERSYQLHGHYGHSSTLISSMIVDGGDGRTNGTGKYIKSTLGAVYVVAGSSGKVSAGTLDHPAMYLSLPKLGSVVLDVDGNRLDAVFISDAGIIDDYLTILKGNLTPSVDAGLDLEVNLSTDGTLDGTVTDDGLPRPPALTTTWSKVSGPGTVSFVNANALDTTAGFSSAGTYNLRLTADDGEASASADVAVEVFPTTNVTMMEIRISASSDDAEERASGRTNLTSSDLELVYDRSDQTIGMRFNGVDVPSGATIIDAYIQFQVDETPSGSTSLTIQAQAADSPPSFSSSSGNISARTPTSAAVSWSPPAWPTKGVAGPDQRTPSIASVIQEVVDRNGWSRGNSLVIIVTGTGERVAESYDGTPSAAPLLHVEYAF